MKKHTYFLIFLLIQLFFIGVKLFSSFAIPLLVVADSYFIIQLFFRLWYIISISYAIVLLSYTSKNNIKNGKILASILLAYNVLFLLDIQFLNASFNPILGSQLIFFIISLVYLFTHVYVYLDNRSYAASFFIVIGASMQLVLIILNILNIQGLSSIVTFLQPIILLISYTLCYISSRSETVGHDVDDYEVDSTRYYE